MEIIFLIKCLTKLEPINPHPPVIKIFFITEAFADLLGTVISYPLEITGFETPHGIFNFGSSHLIPYSDFGL